MQGIKDTTKIKKSAIKQKYNNWDNYNYKAQKGEMNNKPSMTIPDQTMGITELLQRFTRGQSVATFEPIYEFEDDVPMEDMIDMPDISKLDVFDKMELGRQVQEAIKDTREKLVARYIEAQEKKDKKIADKASKQKKPSETSEAEKESK